MKRRIRGKGATPRENRSSVGYWSRGGGERRPPGRKSPRGASPTGGGPDEPRAGAPEPSLHVPTKPGGVARLPRLLLLRPKDKG